MSVIFIIALFSAVLKGSTSFKTAVLCVLCGFYEFFIFSGMQCIKQTEERNWRLSDGTDDSVRDKKRKRQHACGDIKLFLGYCG